MRRILTARGSGQALAEQPAPPEARPGDEALPRVWVDTTRRFQTLLGFGGAFTEAAAVTWQRLGPERRAEVLQACFDPVRGHGYTLCRVPMNSCDFALGHYAHAEVPGDFDLAHFSIERDRQALLPFIQAALRAAGRPIALLVSPWSPPAWMKTNAAMSGGGRLRPECRAAWAQCFVRFIEAYRAEGVPVWGVTVQNEPMAAQRWDSCLYSAEEERDFVRDHLGPALERAGLGDVRIVIWDHNRDGLVERASVVYADREASRYVWGAGFHWYVEDQFDQVQLAHDAWPDKQLLFTEGCQEGGPHTGSWDLGERYARSIINDLNRWTVGWIDWNLLLDERGGPNHVGNFCSAPLLADTAAGRLMPQSSYAYIGHFARFIRPGARRVLCAAGRQLLEATAFANPDGTLAVVVMNRSEQPAPFVLCIDGQRVRLDLPARAITTLLT
ncbi:MAG: glycoside hydrolase family 30 protein [Burkholderiaceae bacterium]|nr:glycoside hydrolase family 30 protein [Burkholderiaceae bacterium]